VKLGVSTCPLGTTSTPPEGANMVGLRNCKECHLTYLIPWCVIPLKKSSGSSATPCIKLQQSKCLPRLMPASLYHGLSGSHKRGSVVRIRRSSYSYCKRSDIYRESIHIKKRLFIVMHLFASDYKPVYSETKFRRFDRRSRGGQFMKYHTSILAKMETSVIPIVTKV
jgi:hypothetical protein